MRRCSAGFYLYSIKDNPLQNLTCQGSRKVDFDSVITELCVREYQPLSFSCNILNSHLCSQGV